MLFTISNFLPQIGENRLLLYSIKDKGHVWSCNVEIIECKINDVVKLYVEGSSVMFHISIKNYCWVRVLIHIYFVCFWAIIHLICILSNIQKRLLWKTNHDRERAWRTTVYSLLIPVKFHSCSLVFLRLLFFYSLFSFKIYYTYFSLSIYIYVYHIHSSRYLHTCAYQYV